MDRKNYRHWLGLGAASLLAALISACGGGDDSPAPAPVVPPPPVVVEPPVAVPTGTSPITLTASTPPATFAALAPKVTVGKVTISSPPVVHFSVTDQDGNAIIGLGSQSQSATATLASYPNIAFSLAKLVPGASGSPSKWVSYIVTTVPTYKSATDKTVVPSAPTRPSTDNTGTLVDNKNGTYTYTFYRDVTKIKADVDAMTVSAPNNKADLGDLTYEPNLVHRLTIQLSGNAPGTGTNTPDAVQKVAGVPMVNPFDAIYDFVPATGKAVTAADPSRDIVATSKCNDCHQKLGGIPGDNPESSAAGFHGGSRNETRYCVVCHTEQRKYGQTEAKIDTATNTFTSATRVVDGRAIGNLPNYIHKIHLGGMLAKKNYDYAGVKPNEVHFPQDIRNCTKCHDGSDSSTAKTAQGDNWKNVPSRLACGSCHDGIDFATGRGVSLADAVKGLTKSEKAPHGFAGPQADDSRCAACHSPAGIDVAHLPVTPPNFGSALHVAGGSPNTNAAWIASNTSRMPAGAIKVSYEIKSVKRNADKQPEIVFRLLQNGARKDLNDPTKATEIWDNFMGSPSLYFVFAVPQDGIAKPSDFNASASGYLRNIWNGSATGNSAGKLNGPDTDGWYTGTLTGVTIPDSAVMLTGGIGYSYNVSLTLPLTQTNLDDYPVAASPIGHANKVGGLIVVAPNVQKVADGYTGRRQIVEDARCNKCHQELGAFTEEAFHGGQRNDGTTCSWCHNPNRTSSGWSADSTVFVHAVHGAAKRRDNYTWHSEIEAWKIHYPGVLANCEGCHVPGSYEFSATPGDAKAVAWESKPYRTVAATTGPLTASPNLSPFVTAGVDYGLGFSFNPGKSPAGGVAPGVTREAASTTLVISPTASVCYACHDLSAANKKIPDDAGRMLSKEHMVNEGGSIYAPRSAALAKPELCVTCHGPGRAADIKVMHSK